MNLDKGRERGRDDIRSRIAPRRSARGLCAREYGSPFVPDTSISQVSTPNSLTAAAEKLGNVSGEGENETGL